jgi:hypothetical protein
MNTERIRELAKQAGDDWDHTLESDKEFLKKFAELIAAEERNRIWTQSHWTEYERKIVAAEREACAMTVEQAGIDGFGTLAAAAAIRERKNDAVDS